MQFYERRNITRWIIIITSFVIVSLILWNTYSFFQIFKEEERVKMQNWALSEKKINSDDPTPTKENRNNNRDMPSDCLSEVTAIESNEPKPIAIPATVTELTNDIR